ncbi:envelope stress sensor histidine kinase CpxA [Rodentibacter abscessus]|uniref:envelope stress sensor histidine kinase CpxA n=1 Tax=Rodentibacter abscessus TaxID=3381777 RepID=UPI00399D2496
MQLKTKFSLNHLTVRIFAVFWFAFLAMIAIILALPYFDNRFYSKLQNNEIANYQKTITEVIRNHKINSILSETPLLPVARFDIARPVLYNPYNKEVFGAFTEEKPLVHRFAENSTDFSNPMRKSFDDIQIAGPFQVYISNNFHEPFSLFFVSRVDPHKEILRYLLNNPLTLLILTLFITTPLLWWFTYTIVKPISRLQEAANRVELGNFTTDPKLNHSGPLELRQVGTRFNRMTMAINELISNQQTLMSSISHEMKTPLTRLQLATALLRHQVGETNAVQRIEKEVARMDKMINELLLISRQQINAQVTRTIFPAEKIWHNVVQDAIFEAEQRHIEFEKFFDLPHDADIFLNGNEDQLQSAVENIIRNALKYTKDKIKLHIFIQEEEEEEEEFLKIRIDDNGSGVHPEELKKIFYPFYRVDETRTRTTGGTGLGLAIVSNVVKGHQGKVWAEKSPLGGLAMTITLPLWVNE